MTADNSQREWSSGLRDQTRQALYDLPVCPDGRLHMKHIGGGNGWFDLLDLAASKFVLHLKGDSGERTFADADEVIAAGWAID